MKITFNGSHFGVNILCPRKSANRQNELYSQTPEEHYESIDYQPKMSNPFADAESWLQIGPVACALLAVDPISVADEALARVLNVHEQSRWRAYRRPVDSRRFLVRAAWRRHLLGARLGCPANDVAFNANSFGKPGVVGGRIHFNASHSEGMAMLALSDTVAVGIDIESRTSGEHWEELESQVLHPLERQAFTPIAAAEKAVVFMHYWTAKEAILKAVGVGLNFTPNRFAVDVSQPEVKLIAAPDILAGHWQIQRFEPCASFVSTLALRKS